jgi:putative ABC transport system permease protein
LCVVAASDAEIGSDAEAILSVATTSGGMLEIPVNATSSDEIAPGLLGLPRDLAGRINAARSRDVRYDPNTGQFNAVGAGARFFRAYAPEIDGLESVVETVRALGAETGEDALLEPVSRVEQVRRIREVSDALLKLYLLIALITGTSGIFAVAANVYAGVQRKRVDLAYLQLLGVHRLALVLFPTIKSLLLVVGAIALALMAYFSFDLVAADVFSGLLPEHTVLTRLDFTAAAALTGAILGAALIASLVAALAVLRVEPGNFIRE